MPKKYAKMKESGPIVGMGGQRGWETEGLGGGLSWAPRSVNEYRIKPKEKIFGGIYNIIKCFKVQFIVRKITKKLNSLTLRWPDGCRLKSPINLL